MDNATKMAIGYSFFVYSLENGYTMNNEIAGLVETMNMIECEVFAK